MITPPFPPTLGRHRDNLAWILSMTNPIPSSFSKTGKPWLKQWCLSKRATTGLFLCLVKLMIYVLLLFFSLIDDKDFERYCIAGIHSLGEKSWNIFVCFCFQSPAVIPRTKLRRLETEPMVLFVYIYFCTLCIPYCLLLSIVDKKWKQTNKPKIYNEL